MNKPKIIARRIVQSIAVAIGLGGVFVIGMACNMAYDRICSFTSIDQLKLGSVWFLSFIGGLLVIVAYCNIRRYNENSVKMLSLIATTVLFIWLVAKMSLYIDRYLPGYLMFVSLLPVAFLFYGCFKLTGKIIIKLTIDGLIMNKFADIIILFCLAVKRNGMCCLHFRRYSFRVIMCLHQKSVQMESLKTGMRGLILQNIITLLG